MRMLKLKTTILSTKTKLDRNGKKWRGPTKHLNKQTNEANVQRRRESYWTIKILQKLALSHTPLVWEMTSRHYSNLQFKQTSKWIHLLNTISHASNFLYLSYLRIQVANLIYSINLLHLQAYLNQTDNLQPKIWFLMTSSSFLPSS